MSPIWQEYKLLIGRGAGGWQFIVHKSSANGLGTGIGPTAFYARRSTAVRNGVEALQELAEEGSDSE